jgi:formylglycine-generating enzyme required for sulfatase activity
MPSLIDDMVAIPAGKSRGRIPNCDRPPPIRSDDEPVDDVEYELAGFEIDRRPVSCVDYEACIAGGGCRAFSSDSGCLRGHALVRNSEAAAYCTWRNARLPEYREWQRAIRGAEGRVYVTGSKLDEAKACEREVRASRPPHRVDYCEHATPEGVVFRTHNMNGGEWTSTRSCRVEGGKRREGLGAADLLMHRLDLFTIFGDAYEFRCARNLSK